MNNEREKFEAWFVRNIPDDIRDNALLALRQSEREDGNYRQPIMQAFWEGWQARAASASETGAEAVGEAGPMPGTDGFTMAAFRADDVPVGTLLYTQPAQADTRIDVEAMLRDCVPGGSICDPQRIADSIREWFDEHGQNAAEAGARVGLTDEQREAIQRAIDYADMSDRDSDAEALRALLQGANHAE